MSRMLRSLPLPQHHHPPMRKPSDHENQVIPFHLDEGTDDLEEIRRRRYSSSASSNSESGSHQHKNHQRGGPRRRPQAHSFQEKESDWERASNGRAEDSAEDEDRSRENEDRRDARKAPSHRREPESPQRMSTKKTQQSESMSESEPEVGDDDSQHESNVSATTTTTTTALSSASAPSTPRTLAASELASLSKLAVFPGSELHLVQGHVERVKTLLHSQYHFYIDNQLILMAEKQTSRTPNYRLFDMTRSATGITSKFNKKSGNYVGKLRSNFTKKKSVLIGNQSRRTELAAVIFSGNVSSSEPRQLTVVLPPLHGKRQEIDGIAVGDESDMFSILVEHYKALKKQHQLRTAQQQVQVFENKQPVFENGFYRLNFHGRVSVPSIKNFQLVQSSDVANEVPIVAKKVPPPPATTTIPREEGAAVYLQFGKVDDNKFHLDFRAPITPIQAFAIALAQFNL